MAKQGNSAPAHVKGAGGAKIAIEYLPVDDLIPYAKNAKAHPPKQVSQIAASLTEFGFIVPVLVDKGNVLVAGHGRILGAKEAGIAQAPVIRAEHLTERQIRAFRIADNKLQMNTDFLEDLLGDELKALDDEGYDLSLLGFSGNELDNLLADEAKTEAAEETPPLPHMPLTAMGDLWVLGRHRLLCGDSTILTSVQRLTAGKPMDLLLTDPPYSSGGRQDGGKRNSTSIGTRSSETIARDNLTTKGYMALMSMVFTNIDAESAYVFTDWRMWTWTYDALEAAGYPVRNMLVWDKERMGMGFPWRAQHELVAFAKRTGASMGDGKVGNVLKCGRQKNELHPTQKPVALIEAIMKNDPGANVYEPFCGSGTTLMAATLIGKNCHAIEVSEGYVDVTVQRWQDFTGEQATLEGDGRTFDEIKASRHGTEDSTKARKGKARAEAQA